MSSVICSGGRSDCCHSSETGKKAPPTYSILALHHAVSKLGESCHKSTGSVLNPLDLAVCTGCNTHWGKKWRNQKMAKAYQLCHSACFSSLNPNYLGFIKAISFCCSRPIISIFLLELHNMLTKK